jgi:hypothetical protein
VLDGIPCGRTSSSCAKELLCRAASLRFKNSRWNSGDLASNPARGGHTRQVLFSAVIP